MFNDEEIAMIMAEWATDTQDVFYSESLLKKRTPPKPPPKITNSTDKYNYKPYPHDYSRGSYGGSPYAGTYGGGTTTYTEKCRHYGLKVTLPELFDGDNPVVVRCSSQFDRKPGVDDYPDYGVYFATSWSPQTWNCYCPWTDYGNPKYPEMAAKILVDVWKRARNGQDVEIGCIGGHGRTGTALACIAVLQGLSPEDAIKWVRKEYCDHAIESDKQEWWVTWFKAYAYNEPAPEEPVWIKSTVTTTTPIKPTSSPQPKVETKAVASIGVKEKPKKSWKQRLFG